MTIIESRLKSGTLTMTVGEGTPVSFACQATNVRIVPKHDEDGDAAETLCGDTLAPDETRTDSLVITSIQDFTDPDGFQHFSWTNDSTVVAFTWAPRGAAGPSFAGDVKVRALEVGGDVNKRLTVDAEWPLVEPAVWTPAA